MLEVTTISVFPRDLIFAVFQHSDFVLFITSSEIADAYHTGKGSPTCQAACTENKLFIWRKKNRGKTAVKIKVKIPHFFPELLLHLF